MKEQLKYSNSHNKSDNINSRTSSSNLSTRNSMSSEDENGNKHGSSNSNSNSKNEKEEIQKTISEAHEKRKQDGLLIFLNGRVDRKKQLLLDAQQQAEVLKNELETKDRDVEYLQAEVKRLKNNSKGTDGRLNLLQYQLKKAIEHKTVNENENQFNSVKLATPPRIKEYAPLVETNNFMFSPRKEAWLIHWNKSSAIRDSLQFMGKMRESAIDSTNVDVIVEEDDINKSIHLPYKELNNSNGSDDLKRLKRWMTQFLRNSSGSEPKSNTLSLKVQNIPRQNDIEFKVVAIQNGNNRSTIYKKEKSLLSLDLNTKTETAIINYDNILESGISEFTSTSSKPEPAIDCIKHKKEDNSPSSIKNLFDGLSKVNSYQNSVKECDSRNLIKKFVKESSATKYVGRTEYPMNIELDDEDMLSVDHTYYSSNNTTVDAISVDLGKSPKREVKYSRDERKENGQPYNTLKVGKPSTNQTKHLISSFLKNADEENIPNQFGISKIQAKINNSYIDRKGKYAFNSDIVHLSKGNSGTDETKKEILVRSPKGIRVSRSPLNDTITAVRNENDRIMFELEKFKGEMERLKMDISFSSMTSQGPFVNTNSFSCI